MAKIENSDVTQKAIKDLRLNAALEKMPTPSSEKIVLTYDLSNKYSNIHKGVQSSLSGATTVYTTPQKKDFYLTSATISMEKDSTATGTDLILEVVIGGLKEEIMALAGITTTKQSSSMSLSFPLPLKIDRNTAITITNSTSLGVYRKTCTITGYEVEQ